MEVEQEIRSEIREYAGFETMRTKQVDSLVDELMRDSNDVLKAEKAHALLVAMIDGELEQRPAQPVEINPPQSFSSCAEDACEDHDEFYVPVTPHDGSQPHVWVCSRQAGGVLYSSERVFCGQPMFCVFGYVQRSVTVSSDAEQDSKCQRCFAQRYLLSQTEARSVAPSLIAQTAGGELFVCRWGHLSGRAFLPDSADDNVETHLTSDDHLTNTDAGGTLDVAVRQQGEDLMRMYWRPTEMTDAGAAE